MADNHSQQNDDMGDVHNAPMPPLGPWAWYHNVGDHIDGDIISLEADDPTTADRYRKALCKPHCLHETQVCDTPWVSYPGSVFPRWKDVKSLLLHRALRKEGPIAFKASWVDVLSSGEFSKLHDSSVSETNMAQKWTDVEKTVDRVVFSFQNMSS
jgi:hypothetical protein